MKKTLITSAILTALSSATVMAQDESKPQIYDGWIAGFGELYKADDDKPEPMGGFDDGTGFGAEIGFRINPKWAARFEWSHLDIDYDFGSDQSGNRIGFDALYFLNEKDTYVFGGVKHERLDTSYRLVNTGIGKHWNLSERWNLVTEAAAYYDFGQDFFDYGLKLGLAYSFGGTSAPTYTKPAAPAPATLDAETTLVDSDADGIYDNQDNCANTPIQDKVDSFGCSIFEEQEVKATLDVLFAHDDDSVENPSAPRIQEFAEFMNRYPNTQAVVEGHTSAVGSEEYNQTLSQKRAEAVRDVLINRYMIDAMRLTAKGYGESQLLDDSNTESAHERNRRVHIVVTAKEKAAVKR